MFAANVLALDNPDNLKLWRRFNLVQIYIKSSTYLFTYLKQEEI